MGVCRLSDAVATSPTVLTVPELALVVLIGASGSGKSTFARRHFKPTEVLSSDFCRGLVSDDENDQAATSDAFDVLHYIARKRLAAGRLTVVDATNVQPEARKPLVALAREYHVLPVAIVLDLPEALCQERNRAAARPRVRAARRPPPAAAAAPLAARAAARGLPPRLRARTLRRRSRRPTIERQPLWNNRSDEHGPFDIIGDVHGCFDELRELLEQLGYADRADGRGGASYARPPPGGPQGGLPRRPGGSRAATCPTCCGW